MPKNWTIRAATKDDGEEMLDVHLTAIKTMGDAFYSSDIRESWAFGLTSEGYCHAMDSGEAFEVAALPNDRVVAFCGVKNGEIFSLYVHPQFQGLGIGKTLYLRGEQRALQQNPDAKRLPLSSTLSAVIFYERLGYVEVERKERKSRGGLMMLVSEMEKTV